MNIKNRKFTALATGLPLIALLGSCTSRPNLTLSPPDDSRWVEIAIKVPPETEVLPLDVLYRSEICRKTVYDNTSESHVTTVRGYNPTLINTGKPDSHGIQRARIALNGGGKCDWQLSAFRIGIQLSPGSALSRGREIIPANYVFDFDDEGYSNGFGQGNPKKASGDLHLTTDFFPVITHYGDNTVAVKLFGGNPRKERWNRYYRVTNMNKVEVVPVVHLTKAVTITPPDSRPGDLNARYSDGTTARLPYIYPDYEKLLQMK